MNRNIMRRVGVAASSAVLSAGLVLTTGYTAFADVGHNTGTAITSTSMGSVSSTGTRTDIHNERHWDKGQARRHYAAQTTTTDIGDQNDEVAMLSVRRPTLVAPRNETIMADAAPAIQVGSDTRAKSQAEALSAARYAITETGLQVTFTSGPHIGGAGTLNGEGVAVLVTCLPVGARTFIEVVGTSLNSGTAEQARNRVRTITMGPPS